MGVAPVMKMKLQLLMTCLSLGVISAKSGNVTALYIFGDSLLDVGNNFYIETLAKPVYPNGIDFGIARSSGRFTNGKTVGDLMGKSCNPMVFFPEKFLSLELLGLMGSCFPTTAAGFQLGFRKFMPPYLKPTTVGDVILRGVNYASSAAGILVDTGSIFGDRIWLARQIDYFRKTRQEIIARLGEAAARELIRRAISIVGIGSNDLLLLSVSNKTADREASVVKLVRKLRTQLTNLYDLDMRKVMVTNAGNFGCVPFVGERNPTIHGCISLKSQIVQIYNDKFERMIEELNKKLAGAKFVVADIDAVLDEIYGNYRKYGFEDVENACCRSGGQRGGLLECNPLSSVCADRKKYLFWDSFHLTETANLIAAKYIMDGGSKFVRPMNVRQLAYS